MLNYQLAKMQSWLLFFQLIMQKKKKIHLLVSPSEASSLLLNYPRIPGTYSVQQAPLCWEVLSGKCLVRVTCPLRAPGFQGLSLWPVWVVLCAPPTPPAVAGVLWPGSPAGCRAPEVLILSVGPHSVLKGLGCKRGSALVPNCAPLLRLQGPELGLASGHAPAPSFWCLGCDFQQVDLGQYPISSLRNVSPHPSWRVQGWGRKLFRPFANLPLCSSVIPAANQGRLGAMVFVRPQEVLGNARFTFARGVPGSLPPFPAENIGPNVMCWFTWWKWLAASVLQSSFIQQKLIWHLLWALS